MLEFVVYATVNSPYKEEFIKKIMELDEDCQTHFMFFIQKALGECDSPLFDQNIRVENREVLILRTEKQRMAVQIEELLKELKELKSQNNKILAERDDLQLEVTDLKNEMSKRSRVHFGDYSDSKEIELSLAEKDVKIMQLTNYLSDIKTSNEKELSKIRDELDVANAKVFNLAQTEKTLAQYKKRIEALSTVKNKMQELEKENEELHEQLELKMIEIENLAALKKTLKNVKDDLSNEKKNTDNLNYKLEMLKKDCKKKETEIEDLRQKLLFAEVRIRDMEKNELDSPSEDSVGYTKLSELDEVFKQPLDIRKESRKLTINVEMDQIRKEKLLVQHKLNKSKIKKKMFREQAQMLYEELSLRQSENKTTITQLNYQLQATTSQLKIVSENMSIAESEKIKLDQCTYELEQVKNTKENLMNEVKRLYEEKDQTYKKLLESREESINLKNIVSIKDQQIYEKETTERIMSEKLQALIESEKVSAVVIENLKQQKKEGSDDTVIKLVEAEKQVINLKSERSELKIRIQEKDKKIEEIVKEKKEHVKKIEIEHQETISRVKEENKRMMNQILNQCDEAITELQKEREIVEAQLRIEKKNAIQEWKKPMDSGWSQSSKEEIGRLKELVNKKDKEIVKLNKSNQEIKKCWKESTRLLKDVWKQIQEETEKIQKASKGYR